MELLCTATFEFSLDFGTKSMSGFECMGFKSVAVAWPRAVNRRQNDRQFQRHQFKSIAEFRAPIVVSIYHPS